jgi:CRISPR-associated endonuclease/helicase Cas3
MNDLDYKSFYKNLTGFAPYDYQIKVAEYLLNGRNVVLSVPTGAGKTWASVVPFLYAKENNPEIFPQKMIYSLPLRTLTNSIYSDITEIIEKNKQYANLSSIQTGEYKDDVYFEKQIVFSTIDQTLSSFLCFPLPLSQRQANINAGALIGSYLVFDEFHLLDPKLSMATSLGMLQYLKNLCRICIMTATLTDDYIQFIKNEFDFEIVSIKNFPNDIEKIKSLKPALNKSVKKSITVYSDKKINVNDILSKHKNKTIVICNRVEKAQQIYNELITLLQKDTQSSIKENNIICLHSRFFDKDRKSKELKLKQLFGKGSSENAILIATQVIEAGMDISCDVMHAEISPINSFLQRAGRCARFENEYGEIFVYDILDLDEKEKILQNTENEADKLEIKKLNNKYLPYDEELCNISMSKLSKHEFIDEKIATKLVNNVLNEKERQIIDTVVQRRYNKDKIQESWRDCDKKHYRETIRDIQSIEIALIDLENLKNKKIIPWQYETISVYKWSFIGWAKQVEDNKINDEDWLFGKAEKSDYDCFLEEKDSFNLEKLPVSEMKNHYAVIFVDNRYFDYTDRVGFFVSGNENNYISPLKPIHQEDKQTITYKKDTFYQHNKGLLNCFETEFKSYLKFAFRELDKYWGEKTDWEYLIKLAICFHDYGKLNSAWQKIVKEFQKRKSGIDNPDEVLAHTDYNEQTDKKLAHECGMKNKPSHAGIGAFVAKQVILPKYGKDITNVIAMSIIKHHGIQTTQMSDFSIDNKTFDIIYFLFKEINCEFNKILNGKGKDLNLFLETPEESILYFLFVRIIRLCDQKATESIDKYLNA